MNPASYPARFFKDRRHSLENQMQFRNLPNVNNVLAAPALMELAAGPQRELVVDLVREELELTGARRGCETNFCG